MSGAGCDPASSGREAGGLDSRLRGNDGRLHSVGICSKPLTTVQRLDGIIKSARKIMRKDKGLNGDKWQ